MKPRSIIPAPVVLATIFLLGQGCASDGGRELPGGDVPLYALNGEVVKLEQFAGKIVILDFWATWCAPCIKEIPGYVELYDKYRAQGVEIIGVAFESGTPDEIQQFIRDHSINYPVLIGNQELIHAFGGIKGYPTTFIIDRAGRIRNTHVGYRERLVFEQEILTLLKDQPAKL